MYDSTCSIFFSNRRPDIVLEEKPESSLVNNVSFAGHVNNSKPHPDTQLDAPNQGQHCAHDLSSLVCGRAIATPSRREKPLVTILLTRGNWRWKQV